MFFGLDILLSCVSFQRYTTTQRSLGRETMEEQSVHHGLQDSGTSGWLIWDVTIAYDGYGMMDRHLCLRMMFTRTSKHEINASEAMHNRRYLSPNETMLFEWLSTIMIL